MNFLQSLLKSARFPYFWIWVGGYIYFGFLFFRLRSGTYSVSVDLILPMIWCITAGNIYLNNINDAFDSETDKLNPRKNDVDTIEQYVDINSSKKIFRRSLLALSSLILIIPFLKTSVILLLCIWALSIYVYNVPGFRFKNIPLLETLFASLHFIPLFIIGYMSQTDILPDLKIILWISLYTWVWIFLVNSLDVNYDKEAGIRNITVRIGNSRLSLIVTLILSIVYQIYTYIIGFTTISLLGSPISLLLIYLLKTKIYETNHPKTYKLYIYITYITGFATGYCLYLGYV